MGWFIFFSIVTILVTSLVSGMNDVNKMQKKHPDATPEEARKMVLNEMNTKQGRPSFSAVAKDGRCPNCGSSAFKAKRGKGALVAGVVTVGVGALAVPKSRVQCIGCKATYTRG